jgi:hypothetical protein
LQTYICVDVKCTYLTIPESNLSDLSRSKPDQLTSNIDDIKECHNYTTSQIESFQDNIVNNADHDYVCNKVINIKEVKQSNQPQIDLKAFSSSSEFDSSDEFSIGDVDEISDAERVEIVFDNFDDKIVGGNESVKVVNHAIEDKNDFEEEELLKSSPEEDPDTEIVKDNSLLDNVGDELLDNDFLSYLDYDQLPEKNERIFDLMLQNESFTEVLEKDAENNPNVTINRSPENKNNVINSNSKQGKRDSFFKVLKSVKNAFSNNITYINKEMDFPIGKYLTELRKLDKMERSLMCLKYDRENIIKTKKIRKNVISENKENETKTYSCNHSDKHFDKELALTEHIKLHKKKYSCSQCEQSFDLVTEWVQHFNTHVIAKV